MAFHIQILLNITDADFILIGISSITSGNSNLHSINFSISRIIISRNFYMDSVNQKVRQTIIFIRGSDRAGPGSIIIGIVISGKRSIFTVGR